MSGKVPIMKFVIFLFLLFAGLPVFAFVQNTVMGYPSCIACHVSPNGGGLLNDYGRALSNEQLSTWSGGDNFAQPFFGAIRNTDAVKWGGDVRVIQANLENDSTYSGQFFLMQQNVEVGYQIDDVMLVGTAGTLEGPDRTPGRGQFLSERHYAIWSPTPMSRFRLGRFRQTFGVFTDNHARLVKDQFGFGSYSETYNMEYTSLHDNYEMVFNTSLGRIDNPRDNESERNFSGHFIHYLNGHSRLGVSVLIGESGLKRRVLSGVNAVVPLGRDWLGIFEFDYERSHLAAQPNVGVDTLASLLRLGYMPFKGFMGYAVFEHLSRDSGASYNLIHQPGLGLQWLPLSHFNVQLEYVRQVNSIDPGNPNHIMFGIFHVYL